MYHLFRYVTILSIIVLSSSDAIAQAPRPSESNNFMVAAANPHAVGAGIEILEAGGGAIDAAVAVQLVLGLVEPQSSGIGGGAFMLYFDAARRKIASFDGRETAPAAATTALFLDATGNKMKFWDAVVGGRSVGVPGVPRMLELAHRTHGKLPWARLFEPAIRLAKQGFEGQVSEALSGNRRLLPHSHGRTAASRPYPEKPRIRGNASGHRGRRGRRLLQRRYRTRYRGRGARRTG
jgi:gamma-glutamyltranspeptidase/glutathione hydrolase